MSSSENRVERRQPNLAERWKWKALIAWIAIFTVATGYSISSIRVDREHNRKQFADSIYENCYRTGVLLVQLIKPGIENTAKLSYYKEHPLERDLVLAQIHDALRLADPRRCKNLPSEKFRQGR